MLRRWVVLAACFASWSLPAAALAFTHWPNATCPDSVTIHQVLSPQDATCHPTPGAGVPGDTVRSAGGIITAFDGIASSYGFYLQNNRADSTGYLAGIDVFTGARNYNASPYNYALGDSVVVEWGCVEQYQGGWELISPNNNQSTPNLIVRKVSSGNHVPDFYVASTTELKTNETNTSANPYLGSLVHIDGPLVVARKNVTGTNNFYLVSPGAPGDSVYVNGYSLTTYGSPEVGTQVAMVQGVFEHRSSTHYAIWLRNGNDITPWAPTPTNLADAYPVADLVTGASYQLRLAFDRDVTPASATNTANYSLASFGSVDAAVMDGTQAVLLSVTNGLAHGATETVTCNGIVAVATGGTMTSPQSRTFVNGVLTVRECSAPDPDSLLGAPCVDRSRFAGPGGEFTQGTPGTRMTFAGVCCGVFGALSYYEDADRSPTGDHGGLSVFGLPTASTPGHGYLVVGQLQEFYGETELYLPVYALDRGLLATPVPIPVTVGAVALDTCEVSNAGGGAGYAPPSAVASGEDFEGMLVKLAHVKRVVRHDYPTKPINGFHVAGEYPGYADTVFVQNLNGVLGASDSLNTNYPTEGTMVDVIGIVHYDSGSFRVCPRTTADISSYGCLAGFDGCGAVDASAKPLAFAVFPNPTHRARITFTLPVAARVDLGVFDVSGRRVATIWHGAMPAGEHSQPWSGRDAAGNRLAAGVYFYRLDVDGTPHTLRGILLGD